MKLHLCLQPRPSASITASAPPQVIRHWSLIGAPVPATKKFGDHCPSGLQRTLQKHKSRPGTWRRVIRKLVPMSQFSFYLLQKLGGQGGLGQMRAFQCVPNTAHLPCMDVPQSFIAPGRATCQLVPATLSVGSFNAVL